MSGRASLTASRVTRKGTAFPEKKVISPGQYALLAAVLISVFKLSVLPSVVSEYAGRDAWMCAVIIIASELMVLVPISNISLSGGVEAIREKYGKVTYMVVTAPVIGVTVIKTMIYIAEVNSFCSSYLFYNVSTEKLGIVIAVAAAFIASTGIKGIARSAIIAIGTLPLIFIIGLAFGEPSAEFSRLLPIGAGGLKALFGGVDKALFFAFDLTPLMFIRQESKEKREGRSVIFLVQGGVFAAIVFFFAAFTAVFGGAYYLSQHAMAALGSFNVVNTEVGAVDWPAVVSWLTFAAIQIALQIWSVGCWAEPLFGKGKAVSVIAGAIVATSGFIFQNIEKAMIFAQSAVKYVTFGAVIISSSVAALLLKFKPKLSSEEKIDA